MDVLGSPRLHQLQRRFIRNDSKFIAKGNLNQEIPLSTRKPLHQLYRYYDAQDRLLYVGISASAVWRLVTHRNQTWYPEISRIHIANYANRDALKKAEKFAICWEYPKYNKSLVSEHNKKTQQHEISEQQALDAEYAFCMAEIERLKKRQRKIQYRLTSVSDASFAR